MKPTYCYVGCYTTEFRQARGKGIRTYRADPSSGKWELIQEIPVAPIVNPSFLAFSSNRKFVFSSHGEHTEASSYKIDPQTGKLELYNRVPTGGYNGAHIAVARKRPYAFVSNYFSGGVAAIRLNEDGSLGSLTDTFEPQGRNGALLRQQYSHPHQITEDPNDRYLICCDLGKDLVYTLDFDEKTGKFELVHTLSTTPAMCPRHMVFHPSAKFAYILAEHLGGLMSCSYDAETGELKPFQLISSIPDTAVGFVNDGAEIAMHPNGRFVYISNRGHDSICAFSIDQQSGRAEVVGWYKTGGSSPRFFTLDESGKFIAAGNEQGDSIVVFRINQDTGELLKPVIVAETPSPSCILIDGPLPDV